MISMIPRNIHSIARFSTTVWKCSEASINSVDHEKSGHKTNIVFLHFGQPRTEYYAKSFLSKWAIKYYNFPSKMQSFIPSSFLLNNKVSHCMETYGSRKSLEDTLAGLAEHVENVLNEIIPEYGTILCSNAFLFEKPNIWEEIGRISRSGSDRIVFFPLYSHFSCSQSGILLNATASSLRTLTVPLMKDGCHIENIRVIPQSNNSFHISAVHRWNSHPTIANYWWDRLQSIRGTFDGVVFCASAMRGYDRKEYHHSVWATCERIMSELDDAVPWKLGFYNAWNEWDLPMRDSLLTQIHRLMDRLPNQKIAIVPVSSFVQDFDTFSVLPNIIQKMENTILLQPEENSSIISQGLAEVIKNHLLGRRNVQLVQYCNNCIRKECGPTRLLFN